MIRLRSKFIFNVEEAVVYLRVSKYNWTSRLGLETLSSFNNSPSSDILVRKLFKSAKLLFLD